jgi:4-hydroxy-tetrahydrodipicolinate reductase
MEKRINVMVNGIPGKMAMEIARAIDDSDDLYVVRASFTGPEITKVQANPYNNLCIGLWKPAEKERQIENLKNQFNHFISVDYTHPSAVKDNADFYCRHNLPFVMGTTGGDRKELEERVKASETCAVIAPNMAAPIVSLMNFMDNYSKGHGWSLTHCELDIEESHQQGKADTSGTAIAMVKYFQRMGIKFDERQILMIRDPEKQRKMGVPEEHLAGHGWHRYNLRASSEYVFFRLSNLGDSLASEFFSRYNPALEGYSISGGNLEIGCTATSPDRNVRLELTSTGAGFVLRHDINGGSVYVDGTLAAVRFLQKKIQEGQKGKVYSMIDVLKG